MKQKTIISVVVIMIQLKHILVTSIISIMLLHTAIPHNHHTKIDAKYSVEYNDEVNIVDVLGLAFSKGNEKDLNESKLTQYNQHLLLSQKFIAFNPVIPNITKLNESITAIVNHPKHLNHNKYFYSNYIPLRAPPTKII